MCSSTRRLCSIGTGVSVSRPSRGCGFVHLRQPRRRRWCSVTMCGSCGRCRESSAMELKDLQSRSSRRSRRGPTSTSPSILSIARTGGVLALRRSSQTTGILGEPWNWSHGISPSPSSSSIRSQGVSHAGSQGLQLRSGRCARPISRAASCQIASRPRQTSSTSPTPGGEASEVSALTSSGTHPASRVPRACGAASRGGRVRTRPRRPSRSRGRRAQRRGMRRRASCRRPSRRVRRTPA